MRFGGLIIALASLALPAAAMSEPMQDPPPPKFRTSVDVVSVSAVVRDRNGQFVRDLQPKDFVVLESGDPRRILDFRTESDGPVKLGLLMDASGSMRVGRKAVDALETARQLLSALRTTDEAALFSFDTQLDKVSDFTSDVGSLEQSLQRLNTPYGQTSLHDAIADAASFVAERARGTGRLAQRTALVVITDGVDTRSRKTTQQVAAIASRIDVPVYIIAVMAPIDDPSVDENPAFNVSDLRELARGTGGDMFTASAPAHASIAARQIVSELRHQYVLAFEASARQGWRGIEVRARDKKLTVRARTGYLAGGSDRPAPGRVPDASFEDHAVIPAAACGAL